MIQEARSDVVITTTAAGVREVRVCTGSGCALSGAFEVLSAFESALREAGLASVKVRKTGCHGLCAEGPLVQLTAERTFYPRVSPNMVDRIVNEHIGQGRVVRDYLYVDSTTGKRVRQYKNLIFDKKQRRIASRNCGVIDPESIDDYLATGGYEALRKALVTMKPEAVIRVVKRSGLRGRGRSGFPTGVKWELGRRAAGSEKYLICNGDEGDPGAFVDLTLLEGDPHSVVEGSIIAAYAIGASKGFFYVRSEYPLAVKRTRRAIEQAKERGFLGENILGSDFSFELTLVEGGGAYICGEETALIASIEGQRGMPSLRPSETIQSGLWGKPTVINNVETLANVAWVISKGAGAFRAIGTKNSPGTKMLALTGKVVNTGLVEVPMGTTLREVVFDIGGGVSGGRNFKGIQVGGPSGACLPATYLDTAIDFDSLNDAGAIMGSGGLVVLDDTTCMVDLARFFLEFTQEESCGKCVPCRVGTKRMLEVIERITRGDGREGDIELLERLALHVQLSSLCGLGQTAPNPVMSTLRHFREEYEEHINEKRCRTGTCRALLAYLIDPEKCTGCTVCKKHCPVGAISGHIKEPHVIDEVRCVACGQCVEHCPFDAISAR